MASATSGLQNSIIDFFNNAQNNRYAVMPITIPTASKPKIAIQITLSISGDRGDLGLRAMALYIADSELMLFR
jgi:hypothetical protein